MTSKLSHDEYFSIYPDCEICLDEECSVEEARLECDRVEQVRLAAEEEQVRLEAEARKAERERREAFKKAEEEKR